MLWLTWQMWILLMLAFSGGIITGWTLRSTPEQANIDKSPEDAPQAKDSIKPIVSDSKFDA